MPDMSLREMKQRRQPHSRLFQIERGRFLYEQKQTPFYYQKNGELEEYDLTPVPIREDLYTIRSAPYDLRIRTAGAFRLRTPLGKEVEVALKNGDFSRHQLDGHIHVWEEVFLDTDFLIIPISGGCRTLLKVKSPQAPHEWEWDVPAGIDHLPLLAGHDAKRNVLLLNEARTDKLIRLKTTGQAFYKQGLRKNKKFISTEEITYPLFIDPVINENVAANADDAFSLWYNAGATYALFYELGSYLFPGSSATYRTYVGVRFQTIAVPAGATINSATLTLRATGENGGGNTIIYGNDVDDAPVFGPVNRIKNMTKTTASTAFSSATWTPGVDNNLDVTSIVAEIVARAGWVSNNDIAFGFFYNGGTPPSGIDFAALDHPTLTEPRLSIDYSIPTKSPPFPNPSPMSAMLRR